MAEKAMRELHRQRINHIYKSRRKMDNFFRKASDEFEYKWGVARCVCGRVTVLMGTMVRVVAECHWCQKPVEIFMEEDMED